jgi:hypothetical protein
MLHFHNFISLLPDWKHKPSEERVFTHQLMFVVNFPYFALKFVALFFFATVILCVLPPSLG